MKRGCIILFPSLFKDLLFLLSDPPHSAINLRIVPGWSGCWHVIMGLLHIKPSFNGSPNCLRSAYIVIRSCYLNWVGGASRCTDKQLFVSGQRSFFQGPPRSFFKSHFKNTEGLEYIAWYLDSSFPLWALKALFTPSFTHSYKPIHNTLFYSFKFSNYHSLKVSVVWSWVLENHTIVYLYSTFKNNTWLTKVLHNRNMRYNNNNKYNT